MKKLVSVEEVKNEGLMGLMDEKAVVTLFCMNYFYTGRLVGVNDSCVKLEDAAVVYETGPFNDKEWKDAQKLPHPLYVMTSSIEAFTVLK